MGFPDVSSFPCPSPYRGCGGWQFGNRIHHLMKSFHPSDINIAEGSIFRPPGKKFLKNLLALSSGLRPAPFCGRSLRYVLPLPSHRHSVAGNDRIMMSLSSFQNKIFKGGCKKGVLMQYKCMEKEIRKLHGRILFPSVMYIANIPAGMQL